MTRQVWTSVALALGLLAAGCGAGAEDDGTEPVIDMATPPATVVDASTIAPGSSTPPATNTPPAITAPGTTTPPGSAAPPGATTAPGSTTAPRMDAGTTMPDGGSTPAAPGSGTPAPMGAGDCCPDGNCLCHTPPPMTLSGRTKGPFKTATLRLSTGSVYYPTDAPGMLASVALCGGYLNTGPEMNEWGAFYASWGIVTNITSTSGSDQPATRATKLLAAVEDLKKENMKSGSPLMGKLTDRYGTSGYSMGGGGTTRAADRTPTLKTSVGLASYSPSTTNTKVPTLLFCGRADSTAPCGSHTDPAYSRIPAGTPKMKITLDGGSHLTAWFGPADGQGGVSGGWALAFQKVFLEGDTRWKPLLLSMPNGATVVSEGIK